jgi:HK97 family phage prohead protease
MSSALVRRDVPGVLTVRAGEERIIEGIVVPWDVVIDAPDGNYRETIPASSVRGLKPGDVRLEVGKHGGPVVARGVEADSRAEGLHMAFVVPRTRAGDDALEEARAGIWPDLSIGFRPVRSRKRPDGVTERSEIDIRRVAMVEAGSYPGAQITAVRAEEASDMADSTISLSGTITEDAAETAPAEAPAPEAPRAAAPVPELVRAVRAPAIVTRAEMPYGPTSGHSFLADGFKASRGDSAAAERIERNRRLVADIDLKLRAGEVLTTEIPGAYPNTYVPGLLTERILKGRPMGSFYNRVAIADGLPRIFPRVTTSTSVAVQSGENVNPVASDYATEAVTVTPLLYGGETVVSRQVLDGADPAALNMIMSDLMEAYAQASETVIKTAVEAGATDTSVTLTAATPHAGLVGLVVDFQGKRFLPAQAQFAPPTIYSGAIQQLDAVGGRLLMPWLGPVNASGTTQDGAAGASVLGVPFVLSWASTPGTGAGVGGVVVTSRADDYVIFESNVAQFSYEQVTGPAGIRIGLWAYLVVGKRRGSTKETGA